MEQSVVLTLAVLVCVVLFTCGSGCPCTDSALCKPITGTREFEVFVFDVGKKDWQHYDWSKVTTVATFGKYDAELMCYAHSKGARFVLKGYLPVKDILDQANRTAWINKQVQLAKNQFMDGINLDLEYPVAKGSQEYFALTALVNETTEAFHRRIPGSQVTFDVAWSPNCIDSRCYDYVSIAESCDFLFVMSYDEQSQIWGDCIAMANAPYNQTLKAYLEYIRMNIHPKKLVMGVPWYGYDYTCVSLIEGVRCTIPKVAFMGAPCSDAAGHQVPYRTLMKQVKMSTSGRIWDDVQKAPYYIYRVDKVFHQVWYDDPQSISLKAAYIKEFGLRGIGMWNGNLSDYGNDTKVQQQTADMWNALCPTNTSCGSYSVQ
ncbi:di-N-acetylchitobiase precursor [Callorhinchus milii]|uniref:Di-N-acetylchitobiase n=1 Tax=Callorhinchus milii TaxID=7868 RepID=K4GIN9_CALMI|nr:di-N-acetylchitobiase precursor [Callorhinchus milii]AFM90998.1 di-N-acetylchitobiase [Callorhinchus milii]